MPVDHYQRGNYHTIKLFKDARKRPFKRALFKRDIRASKQLSCILVKRVNPRYLKGCIRKIASLQKRLHFVQGLKKPPTKSRELVLGMIT